MVVLENKYNKIECPYCHSLLGVQESDVKEGYMGLLTVDCPCCGEEIDYGEKEITIDNIRFPTHFYYFGSKNESKISEEDVKKFIKKAVAYFREHKDNYGFYSLAGRHLMVAKRWPGDEHYCFWIANDYWDTSIPFTEEDTWEGWDDFEDDD